MPAKKPKHDEKPQRERFIEAACTVGADENLDALERALKKAVMPGVVPLHQTERPASE